MVRSADRGYNPSAFRLYYKRYCMRVDLLNSSCVCGLGKFTRGTLALHHRDPPKTLRCTFCRIPVARYEFPALDRLRFARRKKLSQ